ncbi:MAG TPA: methyltransferase domain-containing protein [Dehalococcoidia bacterium]|nr:methyltransferase domain-containing protein [Dehalococcoidia bacterium]
MRDDEEDDRAFYAYARKVVHIDDGAIATVGRLFRDFIPADSTVLDLMSSWRSHWPSGHPRQRLVGLGLNAEEMADNPDLDEYVVHNVNQDPVLPFADEAFDAVVITVSVQYLTRPIETVRQVNRILRPGGPVIVSFSNRMFPTKAVKIWRNSSDRRHLELVASYLDYAGGFEDIKGGLANPQDCPPGDPLFVVMGKKVAASDPDTDPAQSSNRV